MINTSVYCFKDLLPHAGHDIHCVTYEDDDGEAINVAVECWDCGEVLLSYDKYDADGNLSDEDSREEQNRKYHKYIKQIWGNTDNENKPTD